MEAVPDYVDPELDDTELYNLVAANSEVIVKFNSSEMTLSDAMRNIRITKESLSQVIALVYELLANRVTETEEDVEPEEETEAGKKIKIEEERPGEKESKSQDKEQPKEIAKDAPREVVVHNLLKNQNNAAPAKSTEKRASAAELPASPEVTAEKFSAPNIEPVNTPEAASKGTAEDLNQAQVQSKPAANIPHRLGATVDKSPDIPEAPAVLSAQEARPTPIYVDESTPAAEMQKPPEDRQTKTIIFQAEAQKTVAEHEDEEGWALDIENLTGDIVEATEAEPVIPYEKNVIFDNAFFDEMETQLGHFEEVELALEEPDVLFDLPITEGTVTDNVHIEEKLVLPFDGEPYIPEKSEIIGAERHTLASQPEEAIDDQLIQIAWHIRSIEGEKLQEVSVILNSITEVSAKAGIENSEVIISDVAIHEELEELFAELLYKLDIDCTPELIESLASLTIGRQPGGEAEKLMFEEAGNTPQGVGTHEIIRNLLLSLNADHTSPQTVPLGRFAIQLYSLGLAA